MDAPKSTVESPDERQLRCLEERYRHELMDDEERQELRDRVLALRRLARTLGGGLP